MYIYETTAVGQRENLLLLQTLSMHTLPHSMQKLILALLNHAQVSSKYPSFGTLPAACTLQCFLTDPRKALMLLPLLHQLLLPWCCNG